MPWHALFAAIPALFANPESTSPVDYVQVGTNAGIVGLLTYMVTRGIPLVLKTGRELIDMIRADHKEAMAQVTTDRHDQAGVLQQVVGKLEMVAEEQRKHDATQSEAQRRHDADEGKYEREQCERHIGMISESVTSSNLAVASAIDGQTKAVEGLRQAVTGMVAVSARVIDKKDGMA